LFHKQTRTLCENFVGNQAIVKDVTLLNKP